jgi:hypothetical protein
MSNVHELKECLRVPSMVSAARFAMNQGERTVSIGVPLTPEQFADASERLAISGISFALDPSDDSQYLIAAIRAKE